ncbi:hypothetical protein JCM4814A_89550 [Streptomyces phaeofaciens JCM 4814]|uniref:Uncharacterized protein n=1 Tax=Streptomyces phaeofaciens TaxID=68254 RepID=A0A918LZU0_9ACTN|nr:hypothetical protein [Streptomyces phaeofaciens]GGT79989.1 hypothetical protein GCM10010226_68010 [Streptomyces phaeofaciens]
MDTWTCEACGRPVAQSDGETTAAAVRKHAREARHRAASVRRQKPGGITQRWRVPEDREREQPPQRPRRAGRSDRGESGTSSDGSAAHSEGGPVRTLLSVVRRSRGAQLLAATVLAVSLVSLAVASGETSQDRPGSGATSQTASPREGQSPASEFSLSDIEGGTWGDAWSAMDDSLRGGEVQVLESATGRQLTFAYSGDPKRDEWTVCAARLTSGSFDGDGWLVTVELADPHDGCDPDAPTEPGPADGHGTEPDVTMPATDDAPDHSDDDRGGGVRPGAWCGDPGAYGYTEAGTRMRCEYGKGDDHRWRRAG